jgi:DNA polymerase-3 subunit gamma/tau
VRFAPAQLRSKVYIVDEAHQITGAAANAFLKTLEEPPAHARFILATTDPEQLLPTIVSRCQRFEFRRVSIEDMTRRLRQVAGLESITINDDALRVIARNATGSLRDALALLEQLALQAGGSSSQPIDGSDVSALLGLSRNDRVEAIVDAVSRRNPGDALEIVQAAVDEGEDPRQLNRQLVAYLRMLLLDRCGDSSDVATDERGHGLAATFSVSELASHARRFSEIDFAIKHSPYPQLPLEVALVEAALAGDPQPHATSGASAVSGAGASNGRPTSLRDRVRGLQPPRTATGEEPAPSVRAQAATITPFPGPSNDESARPPVAAGHAIDVNLIADLWPNVRADVKALNRRIEALLSEVDPVAVSGNLITLAVPYPFHRDKLNTDEVRETVAGVLSRLLQRDVLLTCVLRGEFTAAPGTAPSTTTEPLTPGTQTGDDEEERARMRIQAAKNIFDAEEIDEAPATSALVASEEG